MKITIVFIPVARSHTKEKDIMRTYRGTVTHYHVPEEHKGLVFRAKDSKAMIERIEKAYGITIPRTTSYQTLTEANRVIREGNQI